MKNTKRGISSLITQWWDILGLAEPFKFAGKLILQRCWKTQSDGTTLKWDDIIPTDILNDWEQWKKDVEKVAEMEIPRYIFEGLEKPPRTIYLHGFSDGGLAGYGLVIYIRYFDPKAGRFTCRLIYSASRVAPNNKPLSIPRKELAAATLLVESITKIAEEWKVPKKNVFLHCDSKVVLNWIKQDKDKQTVWVRNRIARIQQSNFSFFWTPGHKNPADFVSKLTSTKRYVNNVAWTEGPEYLRDPKEVWKNEYSATLLAETSLSSEELRLINEEKREKEIVSYCTTNPAVEKTLFDDIMDRHNELHKVLGLLILFTRAYLEFKGKLKKDGQSKGDINNDDNFLDQYELIIPKVTEKDDAPLFTIPSIPEQRRCLRYLIQHTQKLYHSTEYAQLKEKGVLNDKKSSLARLNITLKEGVICLHSRLAQNELLPEQLRFPKV